MGKSFRCFDVWLLANDKLMNGRTVRGNTFDCRDQSPPDTVSVKRLFSGGSIVVCRAFSQPHGVHAYVGGVDVATDFERERESVGKKAPSHVNARILFAYVYH